MEVAQKRGTDMGDVSDAEEEASSEEEAEETAEEKMLKMFTKMFVRPKMEVPLYEGNLNVDELMDWIHALDKYFDYEDVDKDKQVKYVVTTLQGHATLWWDEIHDERRMKGKAKIKDWDRMVVKLKGNFLPQNYRIKIFNQLQNFKEKNMIVKEYIEEIYKLNIKVGHVEENDEKVVRYITSLRFEIQDEISLLSLKIVEDAYRTALTAEEKTHISIKLEKLYYNKITRIEFYGYFEILDPLFNSKFNEICVRRLIRNKN